MITKNGVCYDLPNSPYVYAWRGVAYFFSSEPHRVKFIDNVRKREQWLDDSLSRRFKVTVHMPLLANIQLYTMVETRGFYIVTDDGAEYTNPKSIFMEPNLQQIGINDGTL